MKTRVKLVHFRQNIYLVLEEREKSKQVHIKTFWLLARMQLPIRAPIRKVRSLLIYPSCLDQHKYKYFVSNFTNKVVLSFFATTVCETKEWANQCSKHGQYSSTTKQNSMLIQAQKKASILMKFKLIEMWACSSTIYQYTTISNGFHFSSRMAPSSAESSST